jgi:hypothetical protein
MLEAAAQARLVRWCKSKGLLARKVHSPSARGFPDLLVASPHTRRVMFLEMKARDGRLSRPQKRTIAALQACGVFVGVPRSFADAVLMIEQELGE